MDGDEMTRVIWEKIKERVGIHILIYFLLHLTLMIVLSIILWNSDCINTYSVYLDVFTANLSISGCRVSLLRFGVTSQRPDWRPGHVRCRTGYTQIQCGHQVRHHYARRRPCQGLVYLVDSESCPKNLKTWKKLLKTFENL